MHAGLARQSYTALRKRSLRWTCSKSARATYEALTAAGKLAHDSRQVQLLQQLEIFGNRVTKSRATEGLAKNSRMIRKLYSKLYGPRAVYVHGPVGIGKTFCMDLFYDALLANKLRTHFHRFMLDVHQRIHDWRKVRACHAHRRSSLSDACRPTAAILYPPWHGP